MSNHGILPDKTLTPAERAVKYTLDVLQTRPELAWFLVGTETLSQLLSAEAYRMGLSDEEAREYRASYVLDLDRSDPEQCLHCGERLECPRCDREDTMNFSDAREALRKGQKIRHETMPEGNCFMLYRRGFGYDMLIVVDAQENLSGDDVDFCELFSSAIHDDDAWEVSA